MILNQWLSGIRQAGILGMNLRNARYIMENNPRSAFRIVDDKRLTKALAERIGIPTPKTFQTIESHGDIRKVSRDLLGGCAFALKPARGAGGSGILLITDCVETGFVKQSGDVLSPDALAHHISDILSGIYSLEGLEDAAILEELIHPDPVFSRVTYEGVPDLRIISYRGVPVMAMVRLPTRASDGKANLHRGAIGAGIDIGRGVTLHAVHQSRFITHHPDTQNPVNDIAVPYWREMLVMSAKASDMSGLGYLGVDLVIDREKGPLLLEMNARPGLQIQIANRIGLRGRLQSIDAAPSEVFATPESRTDWAREAFALH